MNIKFGQAIAKFIYPVSIFMFHYAILSKIWIGSSSNVKNVILPSAIEIKKFGELIIQLHS